MSLSSSGVAGKFSAAFLSALSQQTTVTKTNNQNSGLFDSENVSFVSSAKDGGKPKLGPVKGIDTNTTKDGKIGATRQHSIGDCWLLSGVNALSYTSEGRKIIKEALEYKDDRTIVHLKGFGDVEVTNKELEKAKKGSPKGHYSTGDDDMVILELAIQKALDKIADNDCAVNPDAPSFIEKASGLRQDRIEDGFSIEGGHTIELMYLLTGKVGNSVSDKEGIKKALEEFEKNGNKNMAMGASVYKKTAAKDIHGETIYLAAPHAYAIKSVKDGIVTFTNPWDSGVSYKFDIDTFAKAFGDVEVLDLSENNKEKGYIANQYTLDKNGNRAFRMNYEGDNSEYARTRIVYDEKGNVVRQTFRREDGSVALIRNYKDNNGAQVVASEITYSQNGRVAVKTSFDYKDQGANDGMFVVGAASTSEIITFGEDGTKTGTVSVSKSVANAIQKRGIHNYKQFNADEMAKLGELSEDQWNSVSSYLAKNPNASYSEIMFSLEKGGTKGINDGIEDMISNGNNPFGEFAA